MITLPMSHNGHIMGWNGHWLGRTFATYVWKPFTAMFAGVTGTYRGTVSDVVNPCVSATLNGMELSAASGAIPVSMIGKAWDWSNMSSISGWQAEATGFAGWQWDYDTYQGNTIKYIYVKASNKNILSSQTTTGVQTTTDASRARYDYKLQNNVSFYTFGMNYNRVQLPSDRSISALSLSAAVPYGGNLKSGYLSTELSVTATGYWLTKE